jgi:hypothetical protein
MECRWPQLQRGSSTLCSLSLGRACRRHLHLKEHSVGMRRGISSVGGWFCYSCRKFFFDHIHQIFLNANSMLVKRKARRLRNWIKSSASQLMFTPPMDCDRFHISLIAIFFDGMFNQKFYTSVRKMMFRMRHK